MNDKEKLRLKDNLTDIINNIRDRFKLDFDVETETDNQFDLLISGV